MYNDTTPTNTPPTRTDFSNKALRVQLEAIYFDHKNLEDLIQKTIQWAQEPQHYILSSQDDHYPSLLKHISNPPKILYAIGNLDLLASPQIAIVGSRQMSPYGEKNTTAFANFLARAGFTITSGLALGIDVTAHIAALKSGGNTLAVLATGLDNCYPKQHQSIFDQIIQTGRGLIISEHPLGTPPLKTNFPRRNRLISGLSLGVLVVEAAIKSGSLLTAYTALEQGREVFAIPGSIHHALSKGCHELIKKGAKCVESAEDIIEECRAGLGLMAESIRFEQISTRYSELRPFLAHDKSPEKGSDINKINKINKNIKNNINNPINENLSLTLDPEHQVILDCMTLDSSIVKIDDLIEKTGIKPHKIASMLLLLELDGWIQQAPGGYKKLNG